MRGVLGDQDDSVPGIAQPWCQCPVKRAASESRSLAAFSMDRSIREDSRVRLCMSVTGSANLVVNAWTADMADLMNMQDSLERLLRQGGILNSSVILRTRKRVGWLMHPDGCCTGESSRFPGR
ncbi:hypothetical protein [Saccharopolyspora shandongensis]|uniref:hypothetical protein n=1 Tax=Saccharopolyspora shandongensis TaxID=418495 RepID=UPI0015A57634|nr:hypothetical protein [Saccharopolyspora shandongensis]